MADAGCVFFDWPATCYYWAEALTDMMLAAGKPAPVLGLISAAMGGSSIEEWVTDEVCDQCNAVKNATKPRDAEMYALRIEPFAAMTLKGWLVSGLPATVVCPDRFLTCMIRCLRWEPNRKYYQGEADAGVVMGNSKQGLGYGCQLPALVRSWRHSWQHAMTWASRLMGTSVAR